MDKPLTLCIGNVLLDIIYQCEDDSLLKKYHLNYDDGIELAEWQMPLFDDILSGSKTSWVPNGELGCPEVTCNGEVGSLAMSPGGAAQNTARVMQWCLKESAGGGAVAFAGCVGKDGMSKALETNLKNDGVDVAYMYHDTAKTGACAALITRDNRRSMCANIGASRLFSSTHFTSPKLRRIIAKVNIIYCEGFFLTHSHGCIIDLLKICSDKTFCLNLSGIYVCRKFLSAVLSLMPFADVLFCNVDEATALAEMLGMTDSSGSANLISFLAKALPPKCGFRDQRTIVITQGTDPVVVFTDSRQILSYGFPSLDSVVDTIGAGDAFVAGFLAARCLGKSLDHAVSCGVYAAREIIKQKGCSIPKFCPKLENIAVISPECLQ